MALRVATAFSGGFGSVEFALKYLNIKHKIVFACEIQEAQRKSYLQNHGNPTDEFYKDIKEIDGSRYRGEIDYYHLSPPCQSYSIAGKRAGAADDRGGLMFEAIKSIDDVQPKMFSIENVKGLLSVNDGNDWKNIIKDLKSLKGYTISWGIMNAKEQGTPQNRERVFIVGFRGQSPMFNFPKRRPLRYILADLLEDKVDDKYYLSEKMMQSFIAHKERHDAKGNGFGIKPKTKDDLIANAISCKAGSRATDNFIDIELIQVGNIDTKGHNSLWGRVYSTNGIASTQNAKGGGAGAKTGLYIVPRCNNNGGYKKTNISPSVTTSSFEHNNFIEHKTNIRRLTPRECARVQGDFEDRFILDGFSDTKLYEFIGNAMDISTTKNLIERMLEHLESVKISEPQEPSFSISFADKQKTLLELAS